MSAGPIGEAHVLITPDLRAFAAKLRADLTGAIARASDPKVKVDPDLKGFSEKVKAKVKETERTSKSKIPVAPDLSRFSAETRAFLARFDPKEQIKLAAALDRASFAKAVAEAKRIAKGADTKVNVDVDRDKIRGATRDFSLLGRQGKASLRSLNQEVFHSNIRLREMANILGGATLPVLASLASVGVAAFTSLGAAALGAAAAIAVLPGLILAAVQAVGVSALAFGGLGAALKAMGTEQAGAGRAAATGAKQQAAAAETQRRAAESVADAQRALNRIQRDGTQAAIEALRSIRSAQEDLTRARRDALDNLKDLHLEERGLALSQEEAKLRIVEAQQDLNKVLADPAATNLEKQRASLRLRQAQLDRDETVRRIELNKREIKQGVEGAGAVVTARERVADAQRDAARSAKDASQQIADAQRTVTRALRDQAAAARGAGLAAAVAAPAVDKLGQAMANLSPAGQRFARFLFGLKPRFLELRGLAQAGLFPGLEAAITRLVGAHFPALRRIVDATARTLGDLAVEGGKLLSSGPWTRDFEAIGRENVRLIDQFGHVGLNLADAFRNIITAAAPLTRLIGSMALRWSENARGAAEAGRESGRLGRFFKEAGDALQSLLRIAGNVGATLGAIFTAAFPSGAGLLTSLEGATDKMRELATSTRGGAALRDFFDKARPAAETIGRLMVSLARSIFEVVVHLKTATERIAEFLDKNPELAELVTKMAALALAMKALNVAGLAGVVSSIGQLVLSAGPLGLVAAAVLAIGGAIAFAYFNNKPFRDSVDDLGRKIKETLLPALQSFGDFIRNNVIPALQAAVPFVRDQLVAGLDFLFQALEDNKPQLRLFGRLLLEVGKFIAVTLLPALFKLWSVHLRGLFTALGLAVGAVGLLGRVFKVFVLAILDSFGVILDGAASAFGWIPDIGGKLKTARDSFKAFRDKVAGYLSDKPGGIPNRNVIVTARGVFKAPKGIIQLPGGGGDFSTAGQRARGGPIFGPGTGTSDSIPAWLSHGEHVWTAAEVRKAGGHGVMEAWRRMIRGFASGGAVEDAPAGRFRPTARTSSTALEEGLGGFDRNVDRFALALGKSLGSQLNFGGSGKVSGVKFGGAAMSYIAKFLRDAGVAFQIISGFRAGARTRGTGSVSLHALGRALDLVGAGGSSMLDIWRAATKIPFKKEVIFSPAPFQVYGSGKHPGPPTNPATRADHYNHVHVGLFDRGGWLMPGFTLAENRSGRPERVVPATRDHVGRLGFGGQGVTIQQLVVQPLAGRFRLADVLTELALQGVR